MSMRSLTFRGSNALRGVLQWPGARKPREETEMSLTQIVVQVLEAAHADAERQTARDARLDALAARLEDQATMVLELTDAVRGLIARWDSVARPPTTHPVSVHNGAPAFEKVPLTAVAHAAPAD